MPSPPQHLALPPPRVVVKPPESRWRRLASCGLMQRPVFVT
eukprot:CAMPEP_0170421982 /NCGR_PEP_ID=MMETSP0117_2-20130122/36194_1 /TAXON_ID=400756 /ORGANISM="Durinskia baltica, Strain CSIRO CS-38" /LENGTH=40 /DNA_ID= /DNA_START= /DNA_END= /DNA_ORIENTATION=